MLTFERETFTVDTDFFKKDHLFPTNGFFPLLKRSRDSEYQGSFEEKITVVFRGVSKRNFSGQTFYKISA